MTQTRLIKSNRATEREEEEERERERKKDVTMNVRRVSLKTAICEKVTKRVSLWKVVPARGQTRLNIPGMGKASSFIDSWASLRAQRSPLSLSLSTHTV